ncbi:hypothetical protein KL921_003171 [Ogataea angusta]|nr:hypothetical protein KL921_003171 [Ogataea angusta]
MVEVVGVRLDSNTLGPTSGLIATKRPVISWEVFGNEKNWYQGAYQIRIKYGAQTYSTYDVVNSDNNLFVEWPGRDLKSREVIAISIRVAPKSDVFSFSEWSEPAVAQVGILDNSWRAPFISMVGQPKDEDVSPEILFRRNFDLSANKIKSAKIYSTALGVYEIEVNGKKVGQDYLAPGWTSYDHRLLHQFYDITDLLTPHSNAIGARVGSGWYSGMLGFDGGARKIYGYRRAISIEIDVEYENGEKGVILSDEAWKSNYGPIKDAQLYNGEVYDANDEFPGWSLATFEDNSWSPTEIIQCTSKSIEPQAFGYICELDSLKPVHIFETPKKKLIVDFGQNAVGFPRINNAKAPKGHTITLRFAEVLENGELGTRPLRLAKATDQYTFKGDIDGETYAPRFTFHGARYCQVDNWYGEFNPNNIEFVVIGNQMETTGGFECSDKLLNRLHQNVVHSMRGNFLAIPMDCPQRDERLGWTGDIAIFSPTALYLCDCYSFLQSWLKDLKLEQKANGGAPAVVVPDIIHAFETFWNGKIAAIWQDASVIVPYELYRSSGNKHILQTQYESMVSWINYIPKIEGKVRWDKIEAQLGDWLDPSAPPDNPLLALTDAYLVADAFLFKILTMTSETAEILKLEKDAAYYAELASRCRSDFHDAYVSLSGMLTSNTQTAYALAICFGLYNNDEQIRFAGNQLSELARQSDYKISTGFAGTPFVTEALTVTGHIEDAYKMILQKECPSWLYPVSVGATTIWERWDSMLPTGGINPGEMTSFNHYALGSIANWMHERMGGLKLKAPGWREFYLQPMPGSNISYCETFHKSPSGLIKSQWKIEAGKFTYNVTVPLNSTAHIALPDGTTHSVGSGVWSYTCSAR